MIDTTQKDTDLGFSNLFENIEGDPFANYANSEIGYNDVNEIKEPIEDEPAI